MDNPPEIHEGDIVEVTLRGRARGVRPRFGHKSFIIGEGQDTYMTANGIAIDAEHVADIKIIETATLPAGSA